MKKILTLISLIASVSFSLISTPAFSQTKPAYGITEITYINKDGYLNDAGPKLKQFYQKCGATFIVLDGRSKPIIGIDKAADRVAVTKFESYEKAEACLNSKEYNDLRTLVDKYARTKLYIVEGVEPK